MPPHKNTSRASTVLNVKVESLVWRGADTCIVKMIIDGLCQKSFEGVSCYHGKGYQTKVTNKPHPSLSGDMEVSCLAVIFSAKVCFKIVYTCTYVCKFRQIEMLSVILVRRSSAFEEMYTLSSLVPL